VFSLPVNDRVRCDEVAWQYDLAPGAHTMKLKVLNPREGEAIGIINLITYQKN
jgi:hypothetical protein